MEASIGGIRLPMSRDIPNQVEHMIWDSSSDLPPPLVLATLADDTGMPYESVPRHVPVEELQLSDTLLPIVIDVASGSVRYTDMFLWACNDDSVCPEAFANQTVAEQGLPPTFAPLIAAEIRRQIARRSAGHGTSKTAHECPGVFRYAAEIEMWTPAISSAHHVEVSHHRTEARPTRRSTSFTQRLRPGTAASSAAERKKAEELMSNGAHLHEIASALQMSEVSAKTVLVEAGLVPISRFLDDDLLITDLSEGRCPVEIAITYQVSLPIVLAATARYLESLGSRSLNRKLKKAKDQVEVWETSIDSRRNYMSKADIRLMKRVGLSRAEMADILACSKTTLKRRIQNDDLI